MDDGSVAYAVQLGIGAAAPMQTICRALVESPLASIAGATSVGATSFRKIPTPPRTLPHGAPKPGIPLVPLVPNAWKNPTRGLISSSLGTWSVWAPNRPAMSALYAGRLAN